MQYLKFGFPLSIRCPTNLFSTDISNHFSATYEVQAVTDYIDKEVALGALLGPQMMSTLHIFIAHLC